MKGCGERARPGGWWWGAVDAGALSWVQTHGAGVDSEDSSEERKCFLRIFNLAGKTSGSL